MAEVIQFPKENITSGPIDPDEILKANVGRLKELVILAIDKDGEFVIATSEGYAPDILWLIEQGRKATLDETS